MGYLLVVLGGNTARHAFNYRATITAASDKSSKVFKGLQRSSKVFKGLQRSSKVFKAKFL
jgi:hypothetical protein